MNRLRTARRRIANAYSEPPNRRLRANRPLTARIGQGGPLQAFAAELPSIKNETAGKAA
jgi:hypothetical protein